jgi:hypothetical protein
MGDGRQDKVTVDQCLELYVCVILTIEYLWGRPDMTVKNEEKQRKRLRKKEPQFDCLTQGEHK